MPATNVGGAHRSARQGRHHDCRAIVEVDGVDDVRDRPRQLAELKLRELLEHELLRRDRARRRVCGRRLDGQNRDVRLGRDEEDRDLRVRILRRSEDERLQLRRGDEAPERAPRT